MGEYLHSYIEFRTLRVHTCMDSSTKRWTFTLSKFDEPFGVQSHFLKDFWEPVSINTRVILLVKDDMTLYATVVIVLTKR